MFGDTPTIEATAPFVAGDRLVWIERDFAEDAAGKTTYRGHRMIYAVVDAVLGGVVDLRVLVCTADGHAAHYMPSDYIQRPIERILHGAPRRELWPNELQRKMFIERVNKLAEGVDDAAR